MVLHRSQILLIAGLTLTMAAGMVLGLTTGLLKGPTEAHAQVDPPVFQLCKEWESNGVLSGSRTFSFDVSDNSQFPPVQVDIPNVVEGGGPVCVFVSAAPGPVEITEQEPPLFEQSAWSSETQQLRSPGPTASLFLFSDSSCVAGLVGQALEREAQVMQVSPAPTTCIITFFNQEPPPDPVFQLCKEWVPQGAIAPPRDFTFNVGDSSPNSLVQVTIPNVAEDGQPDCILLSAAEGPVAVTETGIGGFDAPLIFFGDTLVGAGFTVEFGLFSSFCGITKEALVRQTDALVQPGSGEPNCTITFRNEDNDVPETRTPTPTIVVCPNCNVTATPPPPTATRTSPPATATNTPPPGTQPPATATPTISVGTQAPGLTDEQRTATAVAAARTAAAQATPIAPRTGGAGPGGTGGALSIALLAAGLIVLSSGLALIAMRGKRR